MQFKRLARHLNIRKRFCALTSSEKLVADYIKKLCTLIMIKIQQYSALDNKLKTKLKDALKFLDGMKLSKCFQLHYELNRPSRRELHH